MRPLTRTRNIARATKFRVEYIGIMDGEKVFMQRDFNRMTSLAQWIDRNEKSRTNILILKRLGLIDDIWEPYIAIGRKTLSLSTIRGIVRELEEDWLGEWNLNEN